MAVADDTSQETTVLSLSNGITIGHIMLLYCTMTCLFYHVVLHMLVFRKKLNMLVKFWIFYLLWQIGQCTVSICWYEEAYRNNEGARDFFWYMQWIINSCQACILCGMAITIFLSVEGFLQKKARYYTLIPQIYKYGLAPFGILNLILIFAVPYENAGIVSYLWIAFADILVIVAFCLLTHRFANNESLYYKANDSNKNVNVQLLLYIVSVGLVLGFIGFNMSALARSKVGFGLAFLGYFHFLPFSFGLYYVSKINCFHPQVITDILKHGANSTQAKQDTKDLKEDLEEN